MWSVPLLDLGTRKSTSNSSVIFVPIGQDLRKPEIGQSKGSAVSGKLMAVGGRRLLCYQKRFPGRRCAARAS
jgi:hypothetical protein